MPLPPDWLDANEIAARLNKSVDHIRRLLTSRRIKYRLERSYDAARVCRVYPPETVDQLRVRKNSLPAHVIETIKKMAASGVADGIIGKVVKLTATRVGQVRRGMGITAGSKFRPYSPTEVAEVLAALAAKAKEIHDAQRAFDAALRDAVRKTGRSRRAIQCKLNRFKRGASCRG